MAYLDGDDKIEIINVIGGGEQAWGAVNTRCVSSSSSSSLANKDDAGGKKGFYSENVYLVKFDLDGKITQAKVFMDTKHAHSHLGEEK